MLIQRDGKTYVQCEMCDAFATFDNAARLGWDWFTGHADRANHYCPKHKNTPEHDATMRTVGVKP